MKTVVGITPANRRKVAMIFEAVLADETVLYIKTKNAHWNVEGHDFYEKHLFFDVQIKQLDEMIDSIAERIRTLDHYAAASMKQYLKLTHLTEATREKNNSEGFIKELVMDHESIILHLREHVNSFSTEYKDVVSTDFATGLMATHEKMAWFLRSHLKN